MDILSLRWVPALLPLLWGCAGAPLSDVSRVETGVAGASSSLEGAARGFPSLRRLDGGPLADGEIVQWIEKDRLHVRVRFAFGPDHAIEEKAVLRQEPLLVQEEWSWRELKDGLVQRQYHVDFASGKAMAEKREEGKLKRWSDKLDIVPGRTFAGFGFSLAIKRLRDRLLRGEKIELLGVGFTPTPRVGALEVSYGGLDRMSMGGRRIQGERFVIHPKIPFPANVVMSAPDSRIWFVPPAPAGFLRSEAPLAEPGDLVVRIDLLPGQESGPAEPTSP
ncbi:MAG TPA: hypothetical protein VF950_20790 [Planctomycetota bacterium]